MTPADCLMVGDWLFTDILMALDPGVAAGAVLTGETQPGDLAGLAPEDLPTSRPGLDRVDRGDSGYGLS